MFWTTVAFAPCFLPAWSSARRTPSSVLRKARAKSLPLFREESCHCSRRRRRYHCQHHHRSCNKRRRRGRSAACTTTYLVPWYHFYHIRHKKIHLCLCTLAVASPRAPLRLYRLRTGNNPAAFGACRPTENSSKPSGTKAELRKNRRPSSSSAAAGFGDDDDDDALLLRDATYADKKVVVAKKTLTTSGTTMKPSGDYVVVSAKTKTKKKSSKPRVVYVGSLPHEFLRGTIALVFRSVWRRFTRKVSRIKKRGNRSTTRSWSLNTRKLPRLSRNPWIIIYSGTTF